MMDQVDTCATAEAGRLLPLAPPAEDAESTEAPRSGRRKRSKGSLLIVDDDPVVRRSLGRVLRSRGYVVHGVGSAKTAISLAGAQRFDVVLSDIAMPDMDGITLLREIRNHDLGVPVVLITGNPDVSTAAKAVEHGAFHYFIKPADLAEVEKVVAQAVSLRRMAAVKQRAAELLGHSGTQAEDRAGLEASFARALDTLWMAFHPIVDPLSCQVFGYEALLRSDEPSLPHPGAVLDAAERLGQMRLLSRTVRDRAAAAFSDAPLHCLLFVNLHPTDLLDPQLFSPGAPLSRIANRVVLEITERATLDQVPDVRGRITLLRQLGFRIAIDDLGSGYSGLASFAQLEPDFVKLDLSLVRDVDTTLVKRKLIQSIASLARDMGITVVAEGVETQAERETLTDIGCDLLQGFLFARPGRPFPEVTW